MWLLACGVLALGCAGSPPLPPADPQGVDTSVWLVSESRGDGPHRGLSIGSCGDLPPIDGTWTLSDRDVLRLERNLHRLEGRTSELTREPEPLDDPLTYDRQYLGVVVAGRKWVYVNAFTASEEVLATVGIEPTHELFVMCDGRLDHWSVLYDPRRRRFKDLAIRGPRNPEI